MYSVTVRFDNFICKVHDYITKKPTYIYQNTAYNEKYNP